MEVKVGRPTEGGGKIIDEMSPPNLPEGLATGAFVGTCVIGGLVGTIKVPP